jgi:arsenate reductase
MAEGWTRHLKGDCLEAYSAGIDPQGINPLAVRAMAEVGVDISQQRSKCIDDLADITFDWVVTVCDNARERCPVFPGTTHTVHVGFDDPPKLAENSRTEEEAMTHYRRVCDEIRVFVEILPESLIQQPKET